MYRQAVFALPQVGFDVKLIPPVHVFGMPQPAPVQHDVGNGINPVKAQQQPLAGKQFPVRLDLGLENAVLFR